MAYSHWTRGVWVVLILCAGRVNQADQPQLAPQSGVLVLRTGRVLRGEIIRVGDRYVVTLGGKDELGVPADSVEMQCESLEHAYRQKCLAQRQPCSAADHLAMADWCLRYELLAPAAEQLAAARQAEPDNPAVAAFERRLQIVTRQSTPAEPSPAAARPRVSPTDLDPFIREMPAGTVEQFTSVVQPLLINRCGASGCHGPNGSSAFRLEYPHWSRTLPRRFTQQNLRATMQYVDKDSPQNSPLLAKATSAHGTCQHAALGDRDMAQLRHLVEWLHRCAAGRTPPTNLSAPDALLMQPDFPPRASALDPPPPAPVAGPPRANATQASPADEPASAPAGTAQPAAPAPSDGRLGQDPFDPAIFNRRHVQRVK